MKLLKITINKNEFIKNTHYSKININNISESEKKSLIICNLLRKLLLKEKSSTKKNLKKINN